MTTTHTRRPPYRLAAALIALLVAVVTVQLVCEWPKAAAAVRAGW